MADTALLGDPTVNTVLGPVPAADLGVTAVHEALLSVYPGAQYAPDITIDRAEIFEILVTRLAAFRAAGGGTIVDSTGMFHGRDVKLYEALSRATGVHIVASTGQGPEELLGGYFLTPQTNPPTPWPADRFAALFGREVDDGMVVPRVERRGGAGLIAIAATRGGMTATDESLVRGGARAALATGAPVSLRFGADALHDLDIALSEGLGADRIVVGGLDRRDAVATGAAQLVAARGAFVALDHVGRADADVVTDRERVTIVRELIAAGHGDRILLSSNVVGVAKGVPDDALPYELVLTGFAPTLLAAGVSDHDVRRILVDNPRALLTVRAAQN
ncbi:phosphotriesterase [Microbacterium fluvii]|uniref:Phosphotriesterase n=1 Tax=Microbacterium fluvii TaxID=415215 RepID=A0ABW2HC80_9MICO|nr:phosphotriesterase [Microbacterium fluvii]MCU4672294.1 phosphotriesterase [Microbacterium fluvii]